MKRWYVDNMLEAIKSNIDKEFPTSIPNKEYLESDGFRDSVIEKAKQIATILGKHKLTSDEYIDSYEIACREYRAKHKTSIQKSKSLVSNVNEWLTEIRKIEAGWQEGSVQSYRNRYFKYLRNNGWSDKVVDEAYRSSMEIVKKLGDPKSKIEFYRRGMVVGSVQSGKTANFNGVINSAFDVGYELVIVLSGLMEDLRKQTQKRIENDVIGKWEGGDQYKGVGNVCAFSGEKEPDDCQVEQVRSVTSIESDFNSGIFKSDEPLDGRKIFICKKNVSVLGNLLIWLKEYADRSDNNKIDIPLLIVDDEADNASLNNDGYNEETDPSRTNSLIRAILNIFSKKTYLGYTATPFANLLQYRNETIHEYHFIKNKGKVTEVDFGRFTLADDLFPENFIELLYPPSNYVGIKSFFDSRNPEIKKIEDLIVELDNEYVEHIPPRFYKDTNEPTTNKVQGTRAAKRLEYNEQFWNGKTNDTYPYNLPDSLRDAIKCFIISIAIRYSRMDIMKHSKLFNRHHTMLVHIAVFGTWQNKLKMLIQEEISDLSSAIASSKTDADIFQEFRRIWNNYFYYIVNNIESHLPSDYDDPFLISKDFETEILPLLPKAVQKIETVSVNSSSEGDNLIYGDEEKKYIAIGGNRLSRGFTLEGLTINYFLRGANTMDSLMQMGRWFGYRPGYLDCCKLFTPTQNMEKYNEASLVIEDLEEKFAYLSKLTNRTPSDFTIWIQNNPDVIKLTRTNFLGDLQELSLDYGDSVKMSTSFNIQQKKVQKLWDSFTNYISGLEWNSTKDKGFIFHDTDQEGLMKFIELDGVSDVMVNLNTLGLRDYLKKCTEHNALKNWRIGIKVISGGKGATFSTKNLGIDVEVNELNLIQRSGPAKNAKHAVTMLTQRDIFKARNSTIISSPKDFAIYLDTQQIEEAETEYRAEFKNARNIAKNSESEFEFNGKRYPMEKTEINIPDRAYRMKMDPGKGILVIYLIDYKLIFKPSDNPEVIEYANKIGALNFDTPLLGYALGFPIVDAVTGAAFVSRNVFKEPYDMSKTELLNLILKNGLQIESPETMDEQELKEEVMQYFAD